MARRLDLAALSAGVSVLPSKVFVYGDAYAPIAPDLLALMAQLENAPDSAMLILRDTDMSDFRYFRDINGQPAFLRKPARRVPCWRRPARRPISCRSRCCFSAESFSCC